MDLEEKSPMDNHGLCMEYTTPSSPLGWSCKGHVMRHTQQMEIDKQKSVNEQLAGQLSKQVERFSLV